MGLDCSHGFNLAGYVFDGEQEIRLEAEVSQSIRSSSPHPSKTLSTELGQFGPASPSERALPCRFINTTMRFVLVPLAMLSTPQQLAVLVNSWSFMSTSTGSKPAATPQGKTVSSSLVLPPCTSPTSKAICPTGFRIRCSSWNTPAIAASPVS